MKRSKVLLFGLLSLFLISGCSANSKGESNGATVLKSKGSVWGGKMLEHNAKEYDIVPEVTKFSVGEVPVQKVFSNAYANAGLVVLENSKGELGFYSLFTKDYINEVKILKEDTSFQVYLNSVVSFVLRLVDTYMGRTYIYDAFGNELLNYNYYHDYDSFSFSGVQVNNRYYLTMSVQTYDPFEFAMSPNVDYYYEYNSKGKATVIDSIPKEVSDSKSEYKFGDLFKDDDAKFELDDFGLIGYYWMSTKSGSGLNATVTLNLYNPQHIKQLSFTSYTESLTGFIIIGDKLIFQYMYALPADALAYDVFMKGTKYTYETVSIEILTGKQTLLSLPYVLLDARPIKDDTGLNTYAVANLGLISKDKTIKGYEQWIIDAKGDVYDNLSYFDVSNYRKVGDNYYDQTNLTLYDDRMNRITSFIELNYVSVVQGKWFLGRRNGLLGLLDSNGTIVVPFEYAAISEDIIKENTIGVKDGETYRINLATGKRTLIGKSPSLIANGLYYVKTNEKITVFDAASTLKTYNFALDNPNISIHGRTMNITGKTYAYVLIDESRYISGVYESLYTIFVFSN